MYNPAQFGGGGPAIRGAPVGFGGGGGVPGAPVGGGGWDASGVPGSGGPAAHVYGGPGAPAPYGGGMAYGGAGGDVGGGMRAGGMEGMGQMGSPTALSGSMSSAPVAMPGHLPVAPAAFLHDPMAQSVAQMGLKLGTDALQSSMAAYLPGAVYVWHLLRRYFAVDRQYVVAKLAILAFPWRHGDWARKFEEEFVQDSPQSAPRRVVRYNLPTADVNAPDLYIPLMGFVTYVLLVGLAKGTEMQFTPEVLGQVTSTGIVTLLLEVAVMYGALRAFAGGESVALLDLTAFAAYKYVGLVAASVGWLLAGSVAYYALLLYSGVAMARFLVSALQNDLPVPEIAGRQAQNVVTLAIAGAQILLMLWLGAF